MLRKKYTTQKTFRIDQQLAEDLEALSDILERSQNDLLNVALEKLMQENIQWFTNNIIVDCMENFLGGSSEEENFEMCGIKVHAFALGDTGNVRLEYKNYDGDTLIDHFECELSDTETEEIKKKLRNFSSSLDPNSQEVQSFLKQRMNYR